MKIKDVMSKEVATVGPDADLSEVVAIMHSQQYSCLVVAEDDKPIGIISERGIVGWFNQVQADPAAERKARDVMSAPVVTIAEEAPLSDAVELAENHGIRRLPVVRDGDELVGLITQSDIVRGQRTLLEGERDHLEALVAARTRELEAAKERGLLEQKAGFVGRLAYGLAPALSNPLSSAKVNLAYVRERLESAVAEAQADDAEAGEDGDLHAAFDSIAASLERLQHTVSQLQQFYEREGMDVLCEPTALDSLVSDAVSIAGEDVAPDVIWERAQLASSTVLVDSHEVAKAIAHFVRFLHRRAGKSSAKRNVQISVAKLAGSLILQVRSADAALMPGEADRLFEPALVDTSDTDGDAGARTQLSFDLCLSAAYIARSDGSAKVVEEAEGGVGVGFDVHLPITDP